ncbi:iron complex transport system permease protein [Nocardioides lianchengensis]|uniref:Iron complex transport system permease protein n=2 Tax=Nocardioides lianchengensis TaxID=1045774 RepID=A0A1G7BKL4_9ACTN|nr:iron chelate uptake ABC transporter family permease subunit [Nocardioides lianchengensis]NYG08971.1 iron complex transport system permease protein [Nocardioides lianchengensis]SDE27260.1 iron complex transport system permease protein [Nocardioides lianchengensis]
MTLRTGLAPVLAVAVLLVTMAVALGTGAVAVPVPDVLDVVLRRVGLGDRGVSLLDDQIVWQLRMPRVLGMAAVGAVLGCCGAVLQSLTRNDLADPYLLGLSGGAAVGAVTVIVLGVSVAGFAGPAAVTLAGFAGALAALGLVLLLAVGRSGSLAPTRTVLAGVAVGQACSAYTSLIVIGSGDHDAARRVLTWTLGSGAGFRWGTALLVVGVAVVATLAFSACADHLDAFAFGESSARSLGIEVTRLRWVLLGGTALATAAAVAFAGTIGFVGLVVPHLVRTFTGPRHRLLLPMSALVGATLLVWADTLARSVVDGQEIPVGVVTAAVGVPFFALLLRRSGRSA